LVELPALAPVSLPSQLSYAHVGQVRDLTRRLGEAGNACAAEPAVLSAAAAWAEQLPGASGTEPVRLKMLQFGVVKAWEIPRDEQRAVVIGQNGRASVRRWEGISHSSRTDSSVVLATVHVRAGGI
jgi:hypothetical protein